MASASLSSAYVLVKRASGRQRAACSALCSAHERQTEASDDEDRSHGLGRRRRLLRWPPRPRRIRRCVHRARHTLGRHARARPHDRQCTARALSRPAGHGHRRPSHDRHRRRRLDRGETVGHRSCRARGQTAGWPEPRPSCLCRMACSRTPSCVARSARRRCSAARCTWQRVSRSRVSSFRPAPYTGASSASTTAGAPSASRHCTRRCYTRESRRRSRTTFA